MKYLFSLRILFIFFWSYLFFFGSSYISFYDLFSIFDMIKSFDIIDLDEFCFLEDVIENNDSIHKAIFFSDSYLLTSIFIFLVLSFVFLSLISCITVFELYFLLAFIYLLFSFMFLGMLIFIVIDFFFVINVFELLESYYLDSSSLFEKIGDLVYVKYVIWLIFFFSLIASLNFFFNFKDLCSYFFRIINFFYFYLSWWSVTLVYFFSPFGGDFLDLLDYITFIFLFYFFKLVFSSGFIFFLRLIAYLKL